MDVKINSLVIRIINGVYKHLVSAIEGYDYTISHLMSAP